MKFQKRRMRGIFEPKSKKAKKDGENNIMRSFVIRAVQQMLLTQSNEMRHKYGYD
jgi:hypothetical protein